MKSQQPSYRQTDMGPIFIVNQSGGNPVPANVPAFTSAQDENSQFPSSSGLIDDKKIRHAFVRKVFSILLIMLSVTFVAVSVTFFSPNYQQFVKANPAFYFVSYAVFLITYIALACCKSVARRSGLNIALLALLTLSMSYMLSMITAFHSTESVMIALGITIAVCLAVILFSMQTRHDLTKWSGVLFALTIALFVFGIVLLFFHSRIATMLYGALGAILFSAFLAVDIQLVMGGKRGEISEEDYIFATIIIYLDIVYIFLYILQFLQACKGGE